MPTAITDIVIWILDSTVAITLVLAAGHALLWLVRQPAARQRLAEWTLGGCVLAAVIGLLPGVPKFSLGLVDTVPAKIAPTSLGSGDLDIGIVRSGTHRKDVAPVEGEASAHVRSAAGSNAAAAAWEMPGWWCAIVVVAYVSGVGIMALRLILGQLLLRQTVRRGSTADQDVNKLWRHIAKKYTRKTARLVVTDRMSRPAAAGLFNPVIFVPRRLCDPALREQLQAVLWHELGHVQRRDTATWPVISVLQILFFHHPLFWMLRRELQLMQEYVADGFAARRVGSVEEYARLLMLVLRGDARPGTRLLPVLGAIRRPSDFYRRMERLIRQGADVPAHCTSTFTLWTGVVLALLATGAAAFTLRSPVESSAINSLSPNDGRVAIEPAEQRGLAYLEAHQDPSGGWLPQTGPGVTALALKALLQGGVKNSIPAARRAVAFIETFHHADGGFYRDVTPAYNTAIVMSTLALLPGEEYQRQLTAARGFLQATDRAASGPTTFYGAPSDQSLYDNSATIEALRDSGVGSGDSSMQASLHQVVSGGGVFDRNERDDDAILSNYGAITYAGLKSMLYAGLKKDDPRVRSLVKCIEANYTLDINPGEQSARGQFYYYHTFAQALRAYGEPTITDRRGTTHDWRGELRDRLSALQEPDGSWVNHKQAVWLEGDPILVTTYSVLALQETRK